MTEEVTLPELKYARHVVFEEDGTEKTKALLAPIEYLLAQSSDTDGAHEGSVSVGLKHQLVP